MSEEKQNHLTKAAEMLQKVSKPLIAFVTFATPIVIRTCQTLYAIWIKLPVETVRFLIGFVFCFFGGIYPTLFAVIQAAKHGGLQTIEKALVDLSNEAMVIIEHNKKDDEVDDDNDGIPDVQQIDGKALLIRKASLVLQKINPTKVNDALSALLTIWLSVMATLKVQFARTISLALTIGDFLQKPVDHIIAPTLQSAIPKEYGKWVPVILSWITKSIAMSIAFYVQAVISAFTSALEGGLIMARTLLRVAHKKGYTLFGLVKENHEDSSLDEYLSYAFAAMGFYFQFSMGFETPFPFNIILFPLEAAETYIRWKLVD